MLNTNLDRDTDEERRIIKKFMNSNGYYVVDADEHRLIFVRDTDRAKVQQIGTEVNIRRREIRGLYVRVQPGSAGFIHVMLITDDRVLKFFDLLGYELEPSYAKITKQNISDWWDA